MLLFPPPTAQGMEEWFHAHLLHHQAIIDAVAQTKGIQMPLYNIYPVNEKHMDVWLPVHQQQHNDLAAYLGVPVQDLQGTDFKDRKKREAWFYSHYVQHQIAGQLSGLPI